MFHASLTFLRLDINLQTILTGNKQNNLLSKIELIDFRTFYFAKRFILYGFTSMKDDIKFFRNIFRLSCVGYSFIEAALISKFFKKKKHVIQYISNKDRSTADRLLLSTTFHVSLTGFYPLSCTTLN